MIAVPLTPAPTFNSALILLPKNSLSPPAYTASFRKNGIPLDFLTTSAVHRI
jgi:hypothetical protein